MQKVTPFTPIPRADELNRARWEGGSMRWIAPTALLILLIVTSGAQAQHPPGYVACDVKWIDAGSPDDYKGFMDKCLASNQTSSEAPSPSLEPHFALAREGPASTPAIIGTTNLPDGTNLLITISAAAYIVQDKVKVDTGRFRTVNFSNRGQPLDNGEYSIIVVMSIPSTQPEHVRAIIGNDGEKLRGPLV